MRKLQLPQDSVSDVFSACISNENLERRQRLLAIEKDIVNLAAIYHEAALIENLYLIKPHDGFGEVSRDELKSIYSRKMVPMNAPGRAYYDKIKANTEFGRCPFCGQRVVSTLDHYLPKAHFPALSITPINLIPACSDCNKLKRDTIAKNQEKQVIHPYYDSVDNDQWLFARILKTKPATVEYYALPPSTWEKVLQCRIVYHFTTFKLGSLYSSYAAEEISGIRHGLEMIFEAEGEAGIKVYLEREAISKEKANVNSWQTAFYQATSTSVWFQEEGFRN